MSTSAEVLVRLRALTKRFGSKRALGPIDLDLERQEIVGIVGPDGAGKTTLLRSVTIYGATSPRSSARSVTSRRRSASTETCR